MVLTLMGKGIRQRPATGLVVFVHWAEENGWCVDLMFPFSMYKCSVILSTGSCVNDIL